jgi:hypothetical protein
MEEVNSSEMSVNLYHARRRHIPESLLANIYYVFLSSHIE